MEGQEQVAGAEEQQSGNALTWEKFTAYMDGFGQRLADQFAGREACDVKHKGLEGRLTDGEKKFGDLELRMRNIERNMAIGFGVLAAFQFALKQGWL